MNGLAPRSAYNEPMEGTPREFVGYPRTSSKETKRLEVVAAAYSRSRWLLVVLIAATGGVLHIYLGGQLNVEWLVGVALISGTSPGGQV